MGKAKKEFEKHVDKATNWVNRTVDRATNDQLDLDGSRRADAKREAMEADNAAAAEQKAIADEKLEKDNKRKRLLNSIYNSASVFGGASNNGGLVDFSAVVVAAEFLGTENEQSKAS